MAKVTFHYDNDTARTIDAERTMSIMHAAVINDVDGIVGECGGNAMCATCHVYVREQDLDRLPLIEEDEDEMLDGTAAERTNRSRLSCQIFLDANLDGIEVDLPPTQL